MSSEDQSARPSQKILDKNDIFLYWASGSIPCWRVQIALSEKQVIDYKHQLISLDQNQHKTKPLIDQNPRGQVPSLKIENIVLNESLAICLYLEDMLKNQGNTLLPNEPCSRAQVLQCTFDSLRLQKFGSEDLIYYMWHISPDRYNVDLLKKRKEILVNELTRWNNRLKRENQETLYAIGNHFTLADIFLFPQLAFLVHCGYPIQLHERLDSYYNYLRERPSISQSFPPHWLTTTSNILTDCSNIILEQK